tara:strand:- start:1560 stop:1727 length:168 start_codon:yes stop_codon:yes gene_type:complete
MAPETMTANEKALHFLGGWWKCEGCGLLMEDDLYVCPECDAVKQFDPDADNGQCS